LPVGKSIVKSKMGKGGFSKGGAAKGAQGKGAKAAAAPAKAVRTPINGPRRIGTILEWKGNFGWIQPSAPIAHPKAQLRGGKVYLAAEDVASELDGVGAKVSFSIYSDNSGIGASDCRMSNSAAKPAQVQQVAKPQLKGAAKGVTKGAAKGAAKGVAQVQKPAFQKTPLFASQPQLGKGKFQMQKGGDKGKGKGKVSERKLIHDKFLKGTVVQWRGKMGWIKPNDTIDHPMASHHQGDLYFGQQDVEQEISGEGAKVRFFLYEDHRGLSAGNVKPA